MTATFDGAVLGVASVDAIPSGSVGRPVPPASPPDIPSPQRSTFLAERLRVVLFDLCARVPGTWIRPTPNGVAFETLTTRQTRRLVCSLEDAARALEESTASVPVTRQTT